MRRWIGTLLVAISVATLFADDELPKQEEGEGLEIEPPLLIQSRGPDGLPVVPVAPGAVDLTKLENDLARARRSAAAGEHLYKAGIIAKVEAEERALKVVRLQAGLALALLEAAKSKTAEEQSIKTNESIATTENAELGQAEDVARRATEVRHKAELEMALRNLQRQQKLLALGSGRKADVNRAEKKLADLQHAEN